LDASWRSYNRANAEESRKKTATATGIVTERDAAHARVPPYVYDVGAKVRVLDLASNAIVEIEETIARVRNVQKVNLSFNALRALPRAFGTLVNLRTLDLRGNKLTTLPEDIDSLLALEDLDVRENALRALPRALGKCKTLRRLDASANALKAFDKSIAGLGNCANLEVVRFARNYEMCGALPVAWACATKLKEIDVDDTKCDGVPGEILLACDRLTTLSLRRTLVDVATLKDTDGFDAYERRRQGKHNKQLDSRVLLDESRLDERLR
jgi:Leucine-rich repeat (LRR) protein